jgi:hypothetical protein
MIHLGNRRSNTGFPDKGEQMLAKKKVVKNRGDTPEGMGPQPPVQEDPKKDRRHRNILCTYRHGTIIFKTANTFNDEVVPKLTGF